MPKPHTEVVIQELPNCNFCKKEGKETKADYDGKTIFGYWANMCEEHFKQYGVELGPGRGQRLLIERRNNNEPSNPKRPIL